MTFGRLECPCPAAKGTVIWVCTVVILVVLTLSGIGIGASTAADSAEFQVVDAALEEGDDVIDTRDVEAGPNEIKIIESIEPFAAELTISALPTCR